jgi:hypothetical protein
VKSIDERDEFDREAQAQWEKRRPTDPITEKPRPMTGADRVEVQQLAGHLRRAAHATESDERCEFSLLLKRHCDHCRFAARFLTENGESE